MTPGEFRLRLAYGKVGRLRHLSHLEVVHALERAVRRADLPFAVTQGFNPHLKAAFGPALPVGTAGEREYLDLWLTRYTEAAQALGSLQAASPEDLAPREAYYVAGNAPSLTAALTIGQYRIEIDGEGTESQNVHAALSHLIGEEELTIEHKGKPKVYDLTRAIPKDPRVTGRQGGSDIELAIRMGPQGSLRPETFVRTALADSGIVVSAVRTTRLETLVESDEGIWSRPV